jgi:hypothetical protein
MYILSITLILMMIFGKKHFLSYFKIDNIYTIDFIDKFKDLKDRLSPLTINTVYKLVYYISWCQIHLYKVKKYISPKLIYINSFCDKYLKDKGLIIDTASKQLVFIDNNGNEKHNIHIEDINDIKFIENACNELDYSCLFFLDRDVDKSCVNYVFYEKIPKSVDYKVSNIKFIAIDLDYNNNKYLINLKDSKHNYYIVNNCLNKNFFKYYIKNILKMDINEDDFNYNVTIIDNNVSIFTLLPHQSIIFNENDYNIYPIEYNNININSENITNNELSNSDSDNPDDYVKVE